MGEIAALSASAVWAAASLIFTTLGRTFSPIVMNVLKCVIAVLLMMVTLVLLEGVVWPEDLSAENTLWLGLSGFIGLSVGDTSFFNALTRIGPRRALLLAALVPPITALLAIPILDEPFTIEMAAGMMLTLGGVVWVILERREPPPGEEAQDGFSRSEKLGLLFAFLAVCCQATGNVLTKLGGETASALGISIVRLWFGIGGLAIYMLLKRRVRELAAPFGSARSAWLLFVATFLGTYLGIWLLNAGLKYTYTGIAATLSSTSPVFILPLAAVFLGEKLSLRSILGACIAVVGVAVLFLT